MATRTQSVPQLQKLRVVDAMHPGVIACPFETSLQTVARMMATYRVCLLYTSPSPRDRG